MADCCTIAEYGIYALGGSLISMAFAFAAYMKAHSAHKIAIENKE